MFLDGIACDAVSTTTPEFVIACLQLHHIQGNVRGGACPDRDRLRDQETDRGSVRDQHCCAVSAPALDVVQEHLGGGLIEPVEGLIQQNDLEVAKSAQDDPQLAAVACGQRFGLVVEPRLQPVVVCPLECRLEVRAKASGGKSEVVAHRHAGVQRLPGAAYAAPQPCALGRGVVPRYG